MKLRTLYLTYLQALAFCLFLIISFYFNRFAADDYYFIGEVKIRSFSNFYNHIYLHWHGRWTFNFIIILLAKLSELPYFLLIYNLVSYYILIRSISAFLTSVKEYFNIVTTIQYHPTVISIVFSSVLFFCTASPGDSWLWFTSSLIYFWSTIAFFSAFSCLLKAEKTKVDYFILTLSLLYIGGSNEVLAITCLLILAYFSVKKLFTPSSLFSLGILLVSFLINYLSPGTTFRESITTDLDLIDTLKYTGFGTVKFLANLTFETPLFFIPALLLSIPFYFIGKKTKRSFSFHPTKEFFLSVLTIILVVFFHQLILVYALGGIGPDRATIISSILIAFIFIRYLFLAGNTSTSKRVMKWKGLMLVTILLLLGFNVFFGVAHKKYAIALDERMVSINSQKDLDQVILVSPLPYSGYIYSAEITADSTHFLNQHLQKAVDSKRPIILDVNN